MRPWLDSWSGRSPTEGIGYPPQYSWAALAVQMVKNTCNADDLGSIPGLGRSPGGGHANPPVFLPGESPWTEKPGGLQSVRSQRIGHDWATKHSSQQHALNHCETNTSQTLLMTHTALDMLCLRYLWDMEEENHRSADAAKSLQSCPICVTP